MEGAVADRCCQGLRERNDRASRGVHDLRRAHPVLSCLFVRLFILVGRQLFVGLQLFGSLVSLAVLDYVPLSWAFALDDRGVVQNCLNT